jgi:hypothetical protein
MVILLAEVLDVPLRERNALLLAAGFAPMYTETTLDSPELGQVREALDAILRQQEPFPAVVMNRRWDLLRTNDAAPRFFDHILDGKKIEPANVLHMMFNPALARPHVANWEAVAESLLQRIQREAVGGIEDAALKPVLEEVMRYPGISARLRRPNLEQPLLPIIPVSFHKNGEAFDFFSTVTTLGTPQDITLQEIRIECFFPANRETEARARKLLGTPRKTSARGVS